MNAIREIGFVGWCILYLAGASSLIIISFILFFFFSLVFDLRIFATICLMARRSEMASISDFAKRCPQLAIVEMKQLFWMASLFDEYHTILA